MVGASICLENGQIINGSNQENVAYPSGLCAERVAMFYVGAKFPNVKIKTIAISVFSKNFEVTDVISPCGACRQVMAEYEDKQQQAIKVFYILLMIRFLLLVKFRIFYLLCLKALI